MLTSMSEHFKDRIHGSVPSLVYPGTVTLHEKSVPSFPEIQHPHLLLSSGFSSLMIK